MQKSFLDIEAKLIGALLKELNAFEFDNIKDILSYLKRNIFCNENKLKIICKFKKYCRTTNPIEGAHNGLNKGSLIARKSNLNSMIQGNLNKYFKYTIVEWFFRI